MIVIRLEVLWFSEGIPLWTVGHRDWGRCMPEPGFPVSHRLRKGQCEKSSVFKTSAKAMSLGVREAGKVYWSPKALQRTYGLCRC